MDIPTVKPPDDHVCEGVSQKLIDESVENRKLAKKYRAMCEELIETLRFYAEPANTGRPWHQKAREALAKWEKMKK